MENIVIQKQAHVRKKGCEPDYPAGNKVRFNFKRDNPGVHRPEPWGIAIAGFPCNPWDRKKQKGPYGNSQDTRKTHPGDLAKIASRIYHI